MNFPVNPWTAVLVIVGLVEFVLGAVMITASIDRGDGFIFSDDVTLLFTGGLLTFSGLIMLTAACVVLALRWRP